MPQAGFGAHARPNGTTSVNGSSRYDETVETPTKLKTLEDFLQEADEELSLYWVKEGCSGMLRDDEMMMETLLYLLVLRGRS